MVLLCGFIAGVLLLAQHKRLRGTTLWGPWLWLLISLSGITALEAFSMTAVQPFRSLDAWRFIATTASFCPFMSLLGAKRPQDKAWHFVVLTLWLILALPAAESLVLRDGSMPDVRGARSWFMLILITLGFINALPTRYWVAAMLYGVGQLQLLTNHLPLFGDRLGVAPIESGFTCLSAAVAIGIMTARRRREVPAGLDLLWLDFRDSFGLLWGLRVAERVNADARRYDWPVELDWDGFRGRPGTEQTIKITDDLRRAVRLSLDNLLRRFVSAEWIAQALAAAVRL